MFHQLPKVLNYGQPVNCTAPLNRGLKVWLRALPLFIGGGRVLDLCKSNNGARTGTTAWSGLAPVGGRGSISTPGTSANWVNCGTIPNVDASVACSFSGWIYRAATGDIPAAGFSGGVGDNCFSCIWFSDANVYITASAASNVFGSFSLTGTGWHHIACVFDGSGAGNSTRLLVYADGVSRTLSFSGTIPAALGTVSPFGLGRDHNNRYGKGNYDDWRVYPNRVLSANEVLSLYNASRTGYRRELNWLDRPWVLNAAAVSGNRRRSVILGASI